MDKLVKNDNKNSIVINTHNFLAAKEKIKKFSSEIPEETKLSRFETDGTFFQITEHNVTGKEMNDFVGELQDILITSNNNIIETVKEFDEIYNALEALDKDYIQGILTGIKSAEEVSNQAKQAQEANQKTIEKIIEKFQEFKQKQLEHDKEIEKLQGEYNELKNQFEESGYENLNKKLRITTFIAVLSVIIAIFSFLLR